MVLMRGHGDSVVGPSLPNAVFRAYYTEINARQQLQAIAIGGPINFMTRDEAVTSNDAMLRASARPWALWRAKTLRSCERRAVRRLATGLAALAALLACGGLACAEPIADFYRGKTVRLQIGYGPGGGYDLYARLVAEFLPRHLPGNPAVLPENMPGAGSFVAAKYMAEVAPKDGTVLGSLAQTLALDSAVGSAQVNAANFHYIGRVTSNIDTGAALPSSGITSIADVRARPYTVGASGGGSTTVIYPLALNAYGGTKFKIVRGYKGTNDILLALERGEVDIVGAYGLPGILVSHPGWIDKAEVTLLYQAALKRHRLLPDCRRCPNLRSRTRAGRSCAPSPAPRRSAGRLSPGPACRRSARGAAGRIHRNAARSGIHRGLRTTPLHGRSRQWRGDGRHCVRIVPALGCHAGQDRRHVERELDGRTADFAGVRRMYRLLVADLDSPSYFVALAAADLGFFKREGVDIELVLDYGAEIGPGQLRDGTLHFFGGPAYVAGEAFPGFKGAKLLCALSQYSYWFMAVRADLAVKRGDMAALKGLRISASQPWPEMGMRYMLAEAGISPERDNIRIVPPPPSTAKKPHWKGRAGVDAVQQGLADAYWGNGMRVALGESLGLAKLHLDLRRGDGPPGARWYNFAALTTTERLVDEEPEVAAAAVRAIVKTQQALSADPSLATQVGNRLFPDDEAPLIAELIRRDAPFYAAHIAPEAVTGLNKFAIANGLVTEPVPYDRLVATKFRELWNG